eukprot:COSAG01_NODE_2640_length_7295_cov_4.485955_3_plen_160_part_00
MLRPAQCRRLLDERLFPIWQALELSNLNLKVSTGPGRAMQLERQRQYATDVEEAILASHVWLERSDLAVLQPRPASAAAAGQQQPPAAAPGSAPPPRSNQLKGMQGGAEAVARLARRKWRRQQELAQATPEERASAAQAAEMAAVRTMVARVGVLLSRG